MCSAAYINCYVRWLKNTEKTLKGVCMKKAALAILILFIAAGVAFAQEPPNRGKYIKLEEHDWSLDWTYDFSHPEVMSRENISDTALGFSKVLDHSLDYAIRQATGGKHGDYMGAMIITAFTTGIMEHTLSVSEHEMGHLQVWSRAGIGSDHFTFYDTKDRPHHVSNLFDTWREVWQDSQGLQGASIGLDASGYNELYANPDFAGHFTEIEIMIEAGGLNQMQYSLERISNRIYAGEGHILDGPGWLWRMNDTLLYNTKMDNSDIMDYLKDLKKLGINSNVSHVKNTSLLRYLSGSSMAMYTGVYNFFDHGETKIAPPFTWWPEFGTYLTTHGPTVKIQKPVRDHGATLEPSLQFSLDDTKHEEYGLHFEDRWTDSLKVKFGGFVNRANGYWLDGGATLSPFPWLDLGLGCDYGRGWTYEREINGKAFWFADKTELSVKGTVSIFFRF